MPIFPLYKNLQAPENPNSAMHSGLWFERFFHGYEINFDKVVKDARSDWLRNLKTDAVGSSAELQAKTEKIRQLAASQGGQTRVYQCTAPFVTGMGNPHPLENGFTWHPTLGTPYLPGSAVKGLVRAAVELAYQGEDKAALLKRWFGTETKDVVPEASGCFIFLDALPTKPCKLVPDVMTPHMGKWYGKGGKPPIDKNTQPGDWHNPVPVAYLTARDLQLQFAVMPRPGASDDDLVQVWQALDYALQWLGAGGKTAQGFGTMRSQSDLASEREEKWQSASPKFNRANKSLSVKKGDKQAIALDPMGEKLLQVLPADLQQKIKSSQFVKLTAYVIDGDLVRIEPP
jgi:CRISPR-associated protein Cmr6